MRTYLIKVQGLYNSSKKQYCNVEVYTPDIDFKSMKRKSSGFTINDYMIPDDFVLAGVDRFELVLDLPKWSISHEEKVSRIYFDSIKNAKGLLVVGEDYWINKEKVTLEAWEDDEVVGGTVYNVGLFSRGVDSTLRQYYMGEQESVALGYNDRKEEFEFKLSNYLLNPIGLLIWLVNPITNSVEHVGVLSGISETMGGMILDCDDIRTTLDTQPTKIGLKGISKYLAYNVTSDGESKPLSFTLWDSLLDTLGKKVWKNFFCEVQYYSYYTPFLHHRPPIALLGKDNDIASMYVNIPTALKDVDFSSREELPDIQPSKLLYLFELITGYFMFYEGDIVFKNIFGRMYSFEEELPPTIELLPKVQAFKTVSSPFAMVNRVEIKYKDKSTFYMSNDFISLCGDTDIVVDLDFMDYDEEFSKILLDSFVDHYLYLRSTALAIVKISVPKYEEEFKIGYQFKISDIDRFFTFQKTLNLGLIKDGLVISNNGKGEVEVLIAELDRLKPVAPAMRGVVTNISTSGADNITEITFSTTDDYVDNVENSLLFKEGEDVTSLLSKSPYNIGTRTEYFVAGDSYTLRAEGLNIARVMTSITATTMTFNTTTEPFVLGEYVIVSYANSSVWDNNFLIKGVDKWNN